MCVCVYCVMNWNPADKKMRYFSLRIFYIGFTRDNRERARLFHLRRTRATALIRLELIAAFSSILPPTSKNLVVKQYYTCF